MQLMHSRRTLNPVIPIMIRSRHLHGHASSVQLLPRSRKVRTKPLITPQTRSRQRPCSDLHVVGRFADPCRLGIPEQRLESIVHVLLNVAVEEREPRLVGREINHGATEIGHNHRVLHDPCRLLSVDFDQFPQVPVQMHGMRVVGAVAHREPITRSLAAARIRVRGDRVSRSRAIS